jgi:hypothetical protein
MEGGARRRVRGLVELEFGEGLKSSEKSTEGAMIFNRGRLPNEFSPDFKILLPSPKYLGVLFWCS